MTKEELLVEKEGLSIITILGMVSVVGSVSCKNIGNISQSWYIMGLSIGAISIVTKAAYTCQRAMREISNIRIDSIDSNELTYKK